MTQTPAEAHPGTAALEAFRQLQKSADPIKSNGAGQRIIEGLKEAVAGDFASVTILGQKWIRATTTSEYQRGWDDCYAHVLKVLGEHFTLPASGKEG